MRSLELTFSFEPVAYLHRIAPRPLMFIAAEGDTLMPIEASRETFPRAGEPKQFVSLPCGHFAPYVELRGYSPIGAFKNIAKSTRPLAVRGPLSAIATSSNKFREFSLYRSQGSDVASPAIPS